MDPKLSIATKVITTLAFDLALKLHFQCMFQPFIIINVLDKIDNKIELLVVKANNLKNIWIVRL
jgi:hypothetical protein